jgi:quercetin dioxygenase-like cupin family protein
MDLVEGELKAVLEKARLFDAPIDAVQVLDGIMGLTYYRHQPYQVQLWLVQPNKVIPAHTHPDVDTLLVYVSGRVTIQIPEGEFTFNEMTTQHPRLRPGSALFVPRGGLHGLRVGELGGAFLSVQKWQGKIQSTDQNWQGDVLGPLHKARLVPERNQTNA